MLTPVYTRQFERDLKRVLRRNKPVEKIKKILVQLIYDMRDFPPAWSTGTRFTVTPSRLQT